MAKKQGDSGGYDALTAAVRSGELRKLYILHGEEKYLLGKTLEAIRRALVPDGAADFNYRRYEGTGLTVDEIFTAVDTLPVFARRTLIEIHDYDVFKQSEENRARLLALFEDMPEYACLVIVYDTLDYNPDGRLKFTGQVKKYAAVVEFAVQEQARLLRWIRGHFERAGKRIEPALAEYLLFLTGGLMSATQAEIEKVSMFSRNEEITRADIDAVVEPALDAAAYKLTDALVAGRWEEAAKTMDELLRMREAPHKLIGGISAKMRQLLAARICLEEGLGAEKLKELCGIRYDFQARGLMSGAREVSLQMCRQAVTACADAAFEMNSAGDPQGSITGLLARLAAIRRGARS